MAEQTEKQEKEASISVLEAQIVELKQSIENLNAKEATEMAIKDEKIHEFETQVARLEEEHR